MKKLKKKTEAEVVENAEVTAEETEAEVTEPEEVTEGTPEEYPEQLNEDEKEALANTAPEEEKGEVSTTKMKNVLDLVTDEFNLADKRYTVQQYKDGGSKVTLALANDDYDITITVKDVYSKVNCL